MNHEQLADVPLILKSPTALRNAEVRIVEAGTHKAVCEWSPIEFGLGNEDMRKAVLSVSCGWCRLEVKWILESDNLLIHSLSPEFGVGDVFVIAGQSNSANYGTKPQTCRVSHATACDFATGKWKRAQDPLPGATGAGGSAWPILADLIDPEGKLPIGFLSLGVGSTSVQEWLPESVNGHYSRIRSAIGIVVLNGCTAILWHQGESDSLVGTSASDYSDSLCRIIEESRKNAGWDIPWGVASASFHPDPAASVERQAAVRSGQKAVTLALSNVFSGPDTDGYYEKGYLAADNVHFNEAGLAAHAECWAGCLHNYFSLMSSKTKKPTRNAFTIVTGIS